MSVIMKGMEMPKSCRKCFIKQESCPAIRKRIQVLPKNNHIFVPYNYRYDDCPLGEVVRTGEGLYDTYTPPDKETAQHVTEVFRKSTESMEAEHWMPLPELPRAE